MRTYLLALVLVLGSAATAAAQAPAVPAAPAAPDAAARAAFLRSTTVLTPSALATFGGGATTAFGIGAQVRLDYYPTALPVRFGGWLSGEVIDGATPRIAGGVLGGMWIFDCELGVAYRGASDHYAGSLGLVLGKTIDLGWFSIGGRITIPLVDVQTSNTPLATQGIEGSVVITIGLPLTLDGAPRNPLDCPHPCHHGEPRAAAGGA